MYQAAIFQHKDLAILLLENGADAKGKDDFQRPALLRALEKGYRELETLLLEKGTDPKAKDDFDQATCLSKFAHFFITP
jgi:ankyrin repeat protein